MIREIKAGTVWPTDRYWYHLWHNLTLKKSRTWRVRFRLNDWYSGDDTVGHIKLLGLHDSTLCYWERVKNGGKRQRLSMSHENSDRIIAHWVGNGTVELSAYSYRDGWGPAIGPHPDGINLGGYLDTVSRDPDNPDWTEWVEISIERTRGATVYRVETRSGIPMERHIPQTRKPTLFQMQSGAHSNNGPSSPHAQSTFVWEVKQ